MKHQFFEIFKTIKFKFINIDYFSKTNKLIINKSEDYNYIKFSSKLVKYTKINDVITLFEKIKFFLKTMEKNCKNFDSTIFEKNFKTIMFNIYNLNKSSNNSITGWFRIRDFEPCELGLNEIDSVFHELIHMSLMSDDIPQRLEFYNEGYTQLLEKRYFNYNKNFYPIERLVLSNIENILGRDFMEKEAFKGNLIGTIKELTKYSDAESVEFLISNMNLVHMLIYNCDISEKQYEIQSSLDNVFLILFNCLKEKVNKADSWIEKISIISKFEMSRFKFNANDENIIINYGNIKVYNDWINSIIGDDDPTITDKSNKNK